MPENEPGQLEQIAQITNKWQEDLEILRELETLKTHNLEIFRTVISDGITAAVCFVAAPIMYLFAANDDLGVRTTIPRTVLYELNQLYPPELFQLNCAFASAAAIVGAAYFYDQFRNPPRLREWQEIHQRATELEGKLSTHYQDLWR